MKLSYCYGLTLLFFAYNCFGQNKSAILSDFSGKTGNGEIINLSMLLNKVSVIFYEPHEKVELNRSAKKQFNGLLLKLDELQRADINRIPIIDCTRAHWFFTGIWQYQLIKNSETEKMPLYGDWDGSIRKAFQFTEGEIYVVIIDRKGSIRFYEKGQLHQGLIDSAVNILTSLTDIK
jgi:hypothetical protein